MKTFACTILFTISFSFLTLSAQEVNYEALAGKWEYESPNNKTKILYDFGLDKNYVSTTEHKENELVVKGTYQIDKKNDIDRLKLSRVSEISQSRTIINNYFVKFISTDTLKIQSVTARQSNWSPENRRNTMIFIRKKEKLKE